MREDARDRCAGDFAGGSEGYRANGATNRALCAGRSLATRSPSYVFPRTSPRIGTSGIAVAALCIGTEDTLDPPVDVDHRVSDVDDALAKGRGQGREHTAARREWTMEHTLPRAGHRPFVETTSRERKAGPESERQVVASSGVQAALPLRRLIIALGLFSAVSTIGGGIELLVWRAGNKLLPLELIKNTPHRAGSRRRLVERDAHDPDGGEHDPPLRAAGLRWSERRARGSRRHRVGPVDRASPPCRPRPPLDRVDRARVGGGSSVQLCAGAVRR